MRRIILRLLPRPFPAHIQSMVFRVLMFLLLSLAPAWALESQPHVTARATVSLVSDTDAVAPGTPYRLGLRFRIAPGWHIYSKDPGDAGLPPELEWTLPQGSGVGAIAWPAAETIRQGDLVTFGYTGTVLLPMAAHGAGPVRLHASWLICEKICVPEEADFALAMPVGPPAGSIEAALFSSTPIEAPTPAPALEATPLLAAIGAALLGGLVLNLMPCVFPVLAMKAVAVARLSAQGRSAARAQALGYSCGVIASFLAIGAALVAFRGLGHAVGWGFQFQSPIFVAAMAWVLFAVGLNLSGVFTFSTRLQGAGQSLTLRQGWIASFASGGLAVLVATPCTAPFMSVALAAALTAPPVETMALFAALGVGLAAPAIVLALLPGTAALLPRPGKWMEVLRQALAFPMYAAAAWLIWVLSLEAGADGVLVAGAGLVAIGFAAWVLRFGRLRGPVLAGLALAASLALLPGLRVSAAPIDATGAGHFTQARLAGLRAEGKPVFVNLTASWCVTCLANERLALSTAAVQAGFAARGVTQLTGDWTRQDPDITAFLKAQGRDGVPLYLFFPRGGGPAVILPQVLTPSIVLDAIAA